MLDLGCRVSVCLMTCDKIHLHSYGLLSQCSWPPWCGYDGRAIIKRNGHVTFNGHVLSRPSLACRDTVERASLKPITKVDVHA